MSIIQDCATKPPIVASPHTTVLQALILMATRKVGAVVVVDRDRKVLGIFTERDNMLRVSLERKDMEQTTLGEVMSTSVDCAPPDLESGEALSRMLLGRYRHLPVVDEHKRILGIVSLRRLLELRVSEQETSLEYLHAYMCAGGPG